MNRYIKNIEEMTDSREILEGKPHPFSFIFILILIVIIVGVLIWSYIGEIDVTAKGVGQVESVKDLSTIHSMVTGQVKEVNYHDGGKVNEGQVLAVLDSTEIDSQLEIITSNIEDSEEEINHLNNLIDGIKTGTNPFTAENPRYSKEFEVIYDQIKWAEMEFKQQETSLNKNEIDINSQLNQVDVTEERALAETKNNLQLVKADILNAKKEIESLNLLKDSYEQSENLLVSKDKYYNKFEVYDEDLNAVQKELAALQSLDEPDEITMNKMEALEVNLEKFKGNALLEVDLMLAEETKALEKLEGQQKILELKIEQINTLSEQDKQYLEQQKQLLSEQKSNTDVKQLAIDQIKDQKISELNNRIYQEQEKVAQLSEELSLLEKQKEKFIIKAPITGFVDEIQKMSTGNIVSPELPLVRIVSDHHLSEFTVEISLPESEINKVEVGDTVKYHFSSLPFEEYGELTGKITNLSNSSFINENGSFYKITSTIDQESIEKIKETNKELKVGLLAEAYIVTDTKKIIDNFLEKLNLAN